MAEFAPSFSRRLRIWMPSGPVVDGFARTWSWATLVKRPFLETDQLLRMG